MTSDERETRPSKAALEARDKAMAHQDRAQERFRAKGRDALKKLAKADALENPDEERITLADLKDALHEAREQPHSLPAANPAQVATKALDDVRRSARKLHPLVHVTLALAIGALVAWRLGWLDPPQPLPKQGVAPPTATT